jgi:hypothetical protein
MSAFDLAAATLHADPNLSTAADYRRSPGAWAALRVLLSQPDEIAAGLGGIGARAGTLTAEVIGADTGLTPARGDELRIGATLYAVEEAQRDVLGITWRLTLSERPDALPDALLGAIRYDAWYAPGSGDTLTDAEAATLSPTHWHTRAPFFAGVGDNVALPAGTQATIDAEIDMAANAGLAFWAFLGFPPGDPNTRALDLYRASGKRSRIGFAMVEPLISIYADGAYTASMTRDLGYMAEPGYQHVTIAGTARPLLMLQDTDDADIISAYGSLPATAGVLAGIRDLAAQAGLPDPYIVMLAAEPARAAQLAAYGADAAGTHAAASATREPAAPYTDLAAAAAQWPLDALAAGAAAVVPPLVTGRDLRPRIEMPSHWYGDDSTADPTVYWQPPTAGELTRHVGDTIAWLRGNGDRAPAQIGLIGAWNEFTRGAWLCPSWVDGMPAGDTSRLAVLAASLAASGAWQPVTVEAREFVTWGSFKVGEDELL